MGRALVITSGKGGVGKSTLCANLACALALKGRSVLVVDTDTGLRGLDLLFGLQDHIVYDLTDAAQGVCRLKQAIVKSPTCEGLHLIAAAQSRDSASISPGQMKALINQLCERYDDVLIDCPAGLDRGFFTAISGAQEAILVMLDEPVCQRDAERLLSLLAAQEDAIACRLVVNRVTWQKNQNSTERAQELADKLHVPLLGVMPEDSQAAECARMGTLLANKPDSAAGNAVSRIAERLMGETVDIPPVRRKGFWERLLG